MSVPRFAFCSRAIICTEPLDVTIAAVELSNGDGVIAELAELLIDAVANGGSVSFMHPLSLQKARDFWIKSLNAAALGERIVLCARHENRLVGTVTVLLAFPENQPHRAEIGKLMTHTRWRGHGIARTLMLAAERLAVEHARTLLMLDTATDGGAAPLYERLGYQLVGVVPGFALKPHGGLSGTAIYCKEIS